MDIPPFLIQISILIIFVISAYRAFIFASTKTWPDFLFNAAVALLSLSFLF
jgi:hypothetical protein